MRPPDERVSRALAGGRFLVTDWLGGSEWMGVLRARDQHSNADVRVVVAHRPASPLAEIEARLCRDLPGHAPVLYLGGVDSDDGWGSDGIMLVEAAPRSGALGDTVGPSAPSEVASLGAKLARMLPTATPLGTLRPENIFFADAEPLLAIRGEHLWLRARPFSPGTAPPWRLGYTAPEVMMKLPLVKELEASADVYSLGVVLTERLLGEFPFSRATISGLFRAQLGSAHAPLPETALGALLTRAISPDPSARPTMSEMAASLR